MNETIFFGAVAARERTMLSWEASSSELAFIDCNRTAPGHWMASGSEPSDCYHLYIITNDCFLELAYNDNIRHKGLCARGTVILSSPGEQVLFSGVGPARFLQIRLSENSLVAQIRNAGVQEVDCIGIQTTNFLVDVGLGTLALNHEFAYDAKAPLESPYFSALRQAMLNRIAVLLSRDTKSRKSRSEMLVPAKARRLIEYIDSNLKHHLTLSHLSAVAGISRAHFARAFRNSIGMSPHQFVRHRRLAAAMRLIQNHKFTLAEIALFCGFADQAHLTRTFRSQYGNIPTFFKKRRGEMNPVLSHQMSVRNSQCRLPTRSCEASFGFRNSSPHVERP